MKANKQQSGFSLIELLSVVAIIGIIAAIAIPNLIASRRAANEGAALATMRVIASSEASYISTAGAGSYGSLADLNAHRMVDDAIGSAIIGSGIPKGGYLFSAAIINGVGVAAFDAKAQPYIHSSASAFTSTGTRSFFVNESGVMFYNLTATAPTCTANAARAVTGAPLN